MPEGSVAIENGCIAEIGVEFQPDREQCGLAPQPALVEFADSYRIKFDTGAMTNRYHRSAATPRTVWASPVRDRDVVDSHAVGWSAGNKHELGAGAMGASRPCVEIADRDGVSFGVIDLGEG